MGVAAPELELLSRVRKYLAWGGGEVAVATVTLVSGGFLLV